MTLGQMLDAVRLRCNDPKAQKPSDRTILHLLSAEVQAFLNELNLTGRPWAVDELELDVTAGTEDYQLAATSSFGRPVQVRTLYPDNPAHIERDIDFFDLGVLNSDWFFPKNLGQGFSLDGSPNTAVRMAFYRKGAQDAVWVRALPIPQQAARYQVLYQIGEYGYAVPFDETPLLPQHHALIELRTAISALPHCEWSEDSADNSNRRKELALAFTALAPRLERNFQSYIRNLDASTAPSYRILPFAID